MYLRLSEPGKTFLDKVTQRATLEIFMVKNLYLLSLLLFIFSTTACQTTPPLPKTESAITNSSSPDAQNDFDQEELVIGTESDANTLSYLQPKIIQSPLSIKDDIWDRVRQGFKLNHEFQDKRIDAQMPWFINNQAYLDRVNMRASRYLWHIVEEIEKRNMPSEIALLPIVESAYDPFAYSHARASGVWQFIASTARIMGLRLDWWYDGRRDILASTDASLELLQRLHDNLNNDWLLALAAYNSGEGNVRKAIAKNKRRGKPTDFWHLDLPKETKAYVPKLIALTRLYNDPKHYNIYILPIPNESYFDVVETESQIDLAQAARLASIPIEELYLLNPAFNRWATDPDGPHYLLVPKGDAESFRVALKGFPPDKRIAWEHYTVKTGDTVSTIAAKFHTTSHDVMRSNKLTSNTIRVGSTLMIPVASSTIYSLSAEERAAKSKALARINLEGEKTIHVVKSGESLWSISKRYGVPRKKLAEWNGKAERDALRIGQKLAIWTKPDMMRPSPIPQIAPDLSHETSLEPLEQTLDQQNIPGPGATSETNSEAMSDATSVPSDNTIEETTNENTAEADTAAAEPEDVPAGPLLLPEHIGAPQERGMARNISYRVKSGDSLGKIARKFNVSQKQIVEWNNIDPKRILRKGQKLTLVVDISDAQ
jgi:membrane-bound lytic murein transglycosylase D